MKAVILVGGEGTRLRPLTCNTVKSMLPIVGKPFLEHVILYLKKYGVDDIILTLGYLPDRIRGYFGDGIDLGVKLTYVVEKSPLGTAGAVKNAERYLDETFFVLNGDIFTGFDLNVMIALHQKRKATGTIALTPVEDPTAYGVVETDDQGRIQRFVEKPSRDEVTTNMINAGIYLLEPDVLSYIPADTHCMFEHYLFPLLVEKGEPLYSYPSLAYWIDMGTPEKYLQLHHDLLTSQTVTRLSGLESPSHMGNPPTRGRSEFDVGEPLEGPAMMGKDCNIGAQTQLKGPVVLGDECKIGDNTIIEGSVLWQRVRVGQNVTIRNCIMADDCFIGDDCVVVDSVLADNVVVAKGTTLKPGSKIWPGTRIEPS